MAFNKKEIFEDQDQQLAVLGKVMAHPARIAILRILARKETCICGDLVIELPLAQSTVSQHLKELKKAGLVKGIIDGPRSCYCIDQDAWKKLEHSMNSFLEEVNYLQNQCC